MRTLFTWMLDIVVEKLGPMFDVDLGPEDDA